MVEKFVALIRTMRPMTWISIMITILAGMMLSFKGIPPLKDILSIAVVLPILVLGYANTLNAYTDYKIDEITRPHRAIPSGVLTRRTVLSFAIVLLIAAVIFSHAVLDCVALFFFVITGLTLSTIYSVGPTRVKARGPVAPLAIAAGYVFLPLVGASSLYTPITSRVLLIGIVLTVQTAGASISKDLVDLEGDRALGMNTLPLTLGVEKARLIIFSGLAVPLVLFSLLSVMEVLPLRFLLYLALAPWVLYIRKLAHHESTYEKTYIHSFFFCAASILLSGIAYIGGIP